VSTSDTALTLPTKQ